MELRNITTKKMALTITGDDKRSSYMGGSELVDFFYEFGFNDIYDKNFGTRWIYTENKLKNILKSNKFIEFINYYLDEERYIDINSTKYETQDKIIKYWNKYLNLDNYKIVRNNDKYNLEDFTGAKVDLNMAQINVLSTDFMNEQIDKCNSKIIKGDYDGAITNARSLVEEVLLSVEEKATGNRGENPGKIIKLYNRVKKVINFDPSQKGLDDTLKSILSGLSSIINGLGNLRNEASDSHASQYKPAKHHAELAVNVAKTFTAFIIESYIYQKGKKS